MYKRKNFLKVMCMITAALFSFQCTTISRGNLINTDKKVIEGNNLGYSYRVNRVTPKEDKGTSLEYKFVKIAMNRIDTIHTYEKVKKTDRGMTTFAGMGIGLAGGVSIATVSQIQLEEYKGLRQAVFGILGAALGIIISLSVHKHKHTVGEMQEKESTYMLNPNAPLLPFANQPVEVICYSSYNTKSFKTFTDQNGSLFFDLVNDFKLTKKELEKNYTLKFVYINAETGVKESY